jgi:hypothetical protein
MIAAWLCEGLRGLWLQCLYRWREHQTKANLRKYLREMFP